MHCYNCDAIIITNNKKMILHGSSTYSLIKPVSHWAATARDKMRTGFSKMSRNVRGGSQFPRVSRRTSLWCRLNFEHVQKIRATNFLSK